MAKIIDLEVFEYLIYWMIRFASVTDVKQTFKCVQLKLYMSFKEARTVIWYPLLHFAFKTR